MNVARLNRSLATTAPSQGGAGLRAIWIAAGLALALTLSGCMHRRLTVRSDPPGALVLVDGEEIGTTPVGFDYTYYGTRHITLIKDGYKTLTAPYKLSTPWYQVFPLEFFSDNFAGRKINDWRTANFTLEPEVLQPTEELRSRANALRAEATRTEPYYQAP